MNKNLRTGLVIVSGIQVVFALAFIFQVPAVAGLWPLVSTTQLSFTLIGSIFAAAAASTLWCIFVREHGALSGIALDYIAILLPVTILMLQVAEGRASYIVYGIVCAGGALFGLMLWLQTFRVPIKSAPPTPRIVYGSFVVFVIALAIAGGALILKSPNVLPWNVTPETGAVFGWMFIGAAAYFAYAVVRPSWHNAGGQLAGFLIYDVVLIVPFLQRLSTNGPTVNLVIYLAVVIYSGVLAAYFLFVNSTTRLIAPRPVS